MLRWMQDSICVSAGLTLAWGLSSISWAAETPSVKTTVKSKSAAVSGRAAVDAPARAGARPTTVVAKKPLRVTRNVIRGQSEFEEQPPMVVAPTGVVPPPAPPETEAAVAPTEETGTDALRRLKDRSAKARWEQSHQEWLRTRKSRLESQQPAPSRPATPDTESPASSEPAASEPANAANPFDTESQTPAAPSEIPAAPAGNDLIPSEPANPEATLTPAVPGQGVTRPAVPADRVFLQSRQKPIEQLPNDEDLTRMLNDDSGLRLPPPVRDPAALPKMSEIIPNPKQRPDTSGRPIPEQDAKKYVKLDNIPYTPRSFPEFTYNFQAANVWANPLYFEDPHLERYGHSMHPILQTVSSTALFTLQLGGLPYQMAITPPNEKVYPLGWYLPGDYVPYRMRQIPLSWKATAVEAGLILGVGYATP
ncbi:MAG: hypothetical protein V4719_22730 [Planctomycetota bacterium]